MTPFDKELLFFQSQNPPAIIRQQFSLWGQQLKTEICSCALQLNSCWQKCCSINGNVHVRLCPLQRKFFLPNLTEICSREIRLMKTQTTTTTNRISKDNLLGRGRKRRWHIERNRKRKRQSAPTVVAVFLTILLPCLFTFSLVWTSMHGCSHHIYTCHPSAQSHKRSAQTHAPLYS